VTDFFRDIGYASRQLARTRWFTATAVLTLALGIGGQTLFFAAVNAMVFRPIRATHLDGLYVLRYFNRTERSHGPLAAGQFRRVEADPPPAIARLGAIASFNTPVVAWLPGRAERLGAEVVSSGCLLALDLIPQAGRLFAIEDDVPDAAPVVIISDRIWREWFDGDRAIVGHTTLRLNGLPSTVVGVAPRGYQGIASSYMGTTDLWITPTLAARVTADSVKRWAAGYWTTLVRPRAGATRVEVETAVRTLLTSAPGDPVPSAITLRLYPADTDFGQGRLTGVGVTIISLAGLLLVAACANLANMLFARGAQRAGEVAVRLSLGASRLRIFRLFLMESTLLSVAAAALGLALALGSTSLLGAALPSFQSRNFRLFVDLTPDYRVFLFAFAAGVAAALGVGTAVAWRASAVRPLQALASSGVAIGVTRRSYRLRVGLVALQVTSAVMLLMAAGLYLRLTEKELDRYVVFDTAPLATALVDLRLHGYHEANGREFFSRVLQEVRALPGVEQAALADGFPGGSYSATRPVLIVADKEVKGTDGALRRIEGSQRRLSAGYAGVSPGFLDTVGLTLRRGRDISPLDQDTTETVAVVSENVARILWPDQDAIGKTLMFGSDGHWRTVVGICSDPIGAQVESPLVSPANLVLIPAAQWYRPEMLIVLRSRTPAAVLEPLRTAVRGIDVNVAAFNVATADSSIMSWAAPLHAAAILTGSVGLLALAIATLGVYGVIAYVVSLRAREFGIRLALGARPRQVIKLVVDEAVHLLLIGLLAGVFVTSVAERYFQSQRFRFMPNEISTWATVLFLILSVGLAAAYVPARRASRTDPNVVLRDL
jgi:putative ABC transport system permease protein